ncbi:MAG: hypothetical protein HDR88_17750 [Bacteroides sp.]|nr:hypothetical protein [Bacteroides sp.]
MSDINETSSGNNFSDRDLNSLTMLTEDIRRLEGEIMPQLNMLAEKMPEIYKGYASMVRQTLGYAISLMRPTAGTASKISIATEIGARSVEAFGAYKAATRHNRMLDKFLGIKHDIAVLNENKVTRLLPEVKRKLTSSKRLFEKMASNSYKLSGEQNDVIIRTSNLCLRVLTLYRTNLFLVNLCTYLQKEYAAWLEGKQISTMARPDYYMINGLILKQLFNKEGFSTLVNVTDGNGDMSGAELMLISDPQLAMLTMKNELCEFDTSAASSTVSVLLNANPAFKEYESITEGVKKHVKDVAEGGIIFLCAVIVVGIVVACIWFIPGEWWVRTLAGAAGIGATIRIGAHLSRKAKIKHVEEGEEIFENTDREIAAYCGKTVDTEIDYNRKSTGKAVARAFFGSGN